MNRSEDIIFPDFSNCILNLTASLQKYLNCDFFYPPLPELADLKKSRNIILMVLDGFGENLYRAYAADTFLKKYYLKSITSVFPPTTASAITSLISGKSPWEHGVLGWTLFFKEFAKFIDYLPNWDAITHDHLNPEKYNIYDLAGTESIFAAAMARNPETLFYQITEKKLHSSFNVIRSAANSTLISAENEEQRFDLIKDLLSKYKKIPKFIYSYSTNPDHLEHHHGVFSAQVEENLQQTFQNLEMLCDQIAGTNTTLLITADHGLIDIKEYYYLNEDKQLFDSLILPGFPEARFLSLFIKKHREEQFLDAVDKYKSDFLIMNRAEFLQSGIIKTGLEHEKIDDFIGDYLLIAKSNSALRYIYQQNGKWKTEFKAHHAGITRSEMMVPLIRIDL